MHLAVIVQILLKAIFYSKMAANSLRVIGVRFMSFIVAGGGHLTLIFCQTIANLPPRPFQ